MTADKVDKNELEVAKAAELKANAEELMVYLRRATPESAEWQTKASRLVSLIGVALLVNDLNDMTFMAGVIAIQQAQVRGVKEAKKRNISIVRFKEKRPPSIYEFENSRDKISVVSLLCKMKADWCNSYIAECLKDVFVEKKIIPLLVRWSHLNNEQPEDFAENCLVVAFGVDCDLEIKLFLAKEFQKELLGRDVLSSAQASRDFARTFQSLKVLVTNYENDKKISGVLASLVQSYAVYLASKCPLLVLEAEFVIAIQQFNVSASKTPAAKQVLAYLEMVSGATVSALLSQVQRGGRLEIDYWRPMVKLWSAAYSRFFAQVKEAANLNPIITEVLGTAKHDEEVDGQYETEGAFARLMPAWFTYKVQLDQPGNVEALDLMIIYAAKSIGIEYLGTPGESCSYDPIEHHLLQHGGLGPSLVRILRPGLKLTRADGTVKILVSALVKAV